MNQSTNQINYGQIKAASFQQIDEVVAIKSDVYIYSTHNEEISAVAERFIRTLKNKLYKYMNSLSKMYILISQMIQLINVVIHIMAQLK